ncbi:NAD(P)/FAD-dependent oxidoreductase [Rhodococcoides kyotonense]|nr:NAD(P)-binding protein [Rhodococcus kyotonensis]
MTRPTPDTGITIVGAGIAGAACATVLRDAGVAFRLVDRSLAVGGRMASPELNGRRVDIGAGYFTVRDPEFAALVARWESAGLARPWTDTFGVLSPGATPETSTGPTRWRTPDGLRSLVRSMLADVHVDTETVSALPDGDVVLAMPDPQASRLATVPDAVDYQPVLTVVGEFDALQLPFHDAAFVNDHPVVEFLADDGARRGDDAPVLVAHTTAEFAREHRGDPDSAIAPVVAALDELVGTGNPVRTHVHRWSFGKPVSAHDATFALIESRERRTGFAGDQWCPTGAPRIESAWRSGTDLGRALVQQYSRDGNA